MNINISYEELINCQNYAERVLNFYKLCNKGKLPLSADEAEMAVREYNRERHSFKSIYGYSIRKYLETIVNCIGFYVECFYVGYNC